MCVYNDYDSTSKEGPFYSTFFCTSIFRKSLHGFVHDSGMLRRMILVAKWSLLKFFHNNTDTSTFGSMLPSNQGLQANS